MRPPGYLDLRPAIVSVRRRMFTSEIPAELIDAARANVSRASGITPIEQHKRLRIPQRPEPIKLVSDDMRRGGLTLFVYAKSGLGVIPVPAKLTRAALEKTGFLRFSRENVACRFLEFYPRGILNGVDVPGFENAKFSHFAFCLREKLFDDWLARTARRLRWPLDLKRRQGRGRPKLLLL